MLYAYLLTRSEFKIDTDPDLSSADKKFAHSAYIDLLMLLLELTGHNSTNLNKVTGNAIDKKLLASSVGNAMASDPTIRNIVFKGNHNMAVLAPLVQGVHDRLTATSAYKEFSRKRKIDLDQEVALWTVLFESTLSTDRQLIAAMRQLPGYSNVGFKLAIAKVVETLKSYNDARTGYYTALKDLEKSLEKAHQLYISMFVLIVRLTRAREDQLETAKSKYLATAQDKNPNTRFIDNAFAAALADNKGIEQYIEKYGISWTDDYSLLNSLLESIVNSQIYKDYMDAPSTDWEQDCEFWRQILKSVIIPSDDLNDMLEEKSIYWNDDLHIIGTFVLKTIRQAGLSPDHSIEFLPRYKDEEDSRFGAELFEYATKNRDKYYSYLQMFVDASNWDTDRIAFMDNVIMICAIAEIINFPNIPLPVSLNEYIDIANVYSSSKSGQFINGVLYSVINYLKQEGIINK